MQEFRETLPSWAVREEVLRLVRENQVCVISGQTGCGKTTQVRRVQGSFIVIYLRETPTAVYTSPPSKLKFEAKTCGEGVLFFVIHMKATPI